MVSVSNFDAITSSINEILLSKDKLTPTDFGKKCAKIYKDYLSSNKKGKKNVVKDDLIPKDDKPKRGVSRWNLYIKKQVALMKEEDKDKSKEEKRSSQDMLREASAKWNAGDKETFVPDNENNA